MRLHAFVSGLVQGVFFRSNVSEFCSMMDIKGFVRNLPDGRVEVDAYSSSRAKLEELLAFINKNPGASTVTNVDFTFSDEDVNLSSFSVN